MQSLMVLAILSVFRFLRSQSAKNETQKKMKYRCERSHLGYRVSRVIYRIGVVEACSQTLVCQSSEASVSGSQGGSATSRCSARALTYGSYLARSAINIWSASGPSRSDMPASASSLRRRARSVGGRRLCLGTYGGVLNTWE